MRIPSDNGWITNYAPHLFDGSVPGVRSAWETHHAKKEMLANFLVYFDTYFKGKTIKECFDTIKLSYPHQDQTTGVHILDSSGNTVYNIPGDLKNMYPNDLPVVGRVNGFSSGLDELRPIAVLMQLAQKVYRKNSREFNNVRGEYDFEVQGLNEIIDSYSKHILSTTNWLKLFPKTYADDGQMYVLTDVGAMVVVTFNSRSTHWETWQELLRLSDIFEDVDLTWSQKAIVQKFDEAKANISSWVGDLN